MKQKTVIVIQGPTATGKTSLAIEVAKFLSTSIISADSRQCYKEMSIGVAKPSFRELQEVPHYFISTHSVTEEVNAAVFEEYALEAAKEIFRTSNYVVMVGGTGLYIKAFTEGMDQIPEIPLLIRMAVRTGFEDRGISWLQQRVQEEDPQYFSTGETRNPVRLMRALEVVRTTGKSIREFQGIPKPAREFNVLKFTLNLPKEQLHENIHNRVDQMIDLGLVSEVESLLPLRHLPALRTVGYAELFDYFDGKISLEKAIEDIKTNTRQYAKRQTTWFKKDVHSRFIHPSDKKAILDAIKA